MLEVTFGMIRYYSWSITKNKEAPNIPPIF